MAGAIKQYLGRGLLSFCDSVPAAKPLLKRWGLRTSQAWFEDRIVRVQMPDGRSFKLAGLSQNYLSFELFWRGTEYYEPITTLLARELVRGVDAFVDVGANIGFYSLVLSVSQPGLRVIAFEPNPKNFRLLEANARLNQLHHLTCAEMAVSDASGTAALHLSASDMSASLESAFEPTPAATIKVASTSLDAYFADAPRPGRMLIKVDVEGHEAAFFRGAEKTIAALKPEIITEVTLHQERLPVSFLKQAGYRVYQITDQGLLPARELKSATRGRFRFLNCLLSTRPESEIADLFKRIQSQVTRIDLTQTSKFVPEEMLHRFRKPRSEPSVSATT